MLGEYDICSNCGWEYDPVQSREPNYAGGANKMSLNEARKAFKNGQKVK
ncbi:CPCC family cysteine-rich protein [Pectobacterium peruviense]